MPCVPREARFPSNRAGAPRPVRDPRPPMMQDAQCAPPRGPGNSRCPNYSSVVISNGV